MLLNFFLIVSTLYFLTLIFFLLGIGKIKFRKSKNSNRSKGISVIVCVRNGEHSILNILNDLAQQSYKGKLEFIIVDDNSTDDTPNIIKEYKLKDNRFKYIHSNIDRTELKLKKKAINAGITNAKYDWLLFTDVDCRVPIDWVKSMSENYHNNNYVVGYSEVKFNNTFISKFQSIDFRMLMISSCASISYGVPLACSGQNQSYKKSLFSSVSGFEKIKTLLQGDDSLFLQICNKIGNLKATFSVEPESFVLSKTHNRTFDFLIQRMRWAGDANIMWRYNKIFFLIILSTFVTNFFILILLLLSFNKDYLFILIFILLIKLMLEFFVYYLGSKKLYRSTNLLHFLLWWSLQPIYIVLMGFLSFFAHNLRWKGRTV